MPKTNSTVHETVFFNGSEYYQSLLQDIGQAENNIDLETYIFSNDSLGEKVVEALFRAAKRGIAVRLLVDGAGTPDWGGALAKRLESAGVQTQIFHPFPWRFWQWSRSKIKKPFIQKIVYLLLKINSRNHRKTCLIDNKIIYVGSFNISKCHLNKRQKGEGWRDTGVRLEDFNSNKLHNAFEAAWNHKLVSEHIKAIFKHENNDPIIRLNNTWLRRRVLYKNLLNKMANCKQRIWIINAYFVPDNFLLKKLESVAQTGVDVRILLPRKSDVLFMPWASTTFYEALLKSKVRIFEYLPSILHAKTLILDDWMVIGSSNLNHRSLLHDLEVDVNVRSTTSKQKIEKQFLLDLQNSKEIRLDNWQRRPLYQLIMGRLLLYIKYWI